MVCLLRPTVSNAAQPIQSAVGRGLVLRLCVVGCRMEKPLLAVTLYERYRLTSKSVHQVLANVLLNALATDTELCFAWCAFQGRSCIYKSYIYDMAGKQVRFCIRLTCHLRRTFAQCVTSTIVQVRSQSTAEEAVESAVSATHIEQF